MKKLTIFLLLLVIVTNGTVAQCPQYWPKLKGFKTNGGLDGGRAWECRDCIAGNCESGNGTYLMVKISGFDFNTINYQYFVYKGIFSDTGKTFRGRAYTYTTQVTGGWVKKSMVYEPVANDNLATDTTKLQLLYEGDMSCRNERYVYESSNQGRYYPQGNLHYAALDAYPGFNTSGTFKQNPVYLNVQFPVDSACSHISGMVNDFGFFLMGSAQTANGVYSGTFYNNQPRGFGVLQKNGSSTNVLFQNGKATPVQQPVFVPDSTALFNLINHAGENTTPESTIYFSWPKPGQTPDSFYIKGRRYTDKGLPAPDDYTGPGFFWKDAYYYYAGMFSNGRPTGNGWLHLANSFNETLTKGLEEYNYYGRFQNGYMVEGAYQKGYLSQNNKEVGSHPTYTVAIAPVSLYTKILTEDEIVLGNAIHAQEKGDCACIGYYQTAAAKGNAKAAYWLAMIYVNGFYTPHGWCAEVNHGLASAWMEKAANLGNADAMFFIGGSYRRGDEYETFNMVKAKEWLQKAAKLGHTEAAKYVAEIEAAERRAYLASPSALLGFTKGDSMQLSASDRLFYETIQKDINDIKKRMSPNATFYMSLTPQMPTYHYGLKPPSVQFIFYIKNSIDHDISISYYNYDTTHTTDKIITNSETITGNVVSNYSGGGYFKTTFTPTQLKQLSTNNTYNFRLSSPIYNVIDKLKNTAYLWICIVE